MFMPSGLAALLCVVYVQAHGGVCITEVCRTFPFPETVMTHWWWCALRPVTTIIFSHVGLYGSTTAQQLNPLRLVFFKMQGRCCHLPIQACLLEVKHNEMFNVQSFYVQEVQDWITRTWKFSCLSSVVMGISWGITFLWRVVCRCTL